jgi:hypothetical protein
MSIAKLKALSPTERHALLPALCRLLVARAALVGGIRWASLRLQGKPARDAGPYRPELWAARAHVLHGLSARLPGVACLSHSLALRWWMRCRGLEAKMHIGVCKQNEGIESHAWVSYEGHVIFEPAANIDRFQVVETY